MILNDQHVICADFLSVPCMKNLFRRLFAVLRAIAETGEPKCQLVSILSTQADHFVLMHIMNSFYRFQPENSGNGLLLNIKNK